jgi:hypothetical protein
MIYAISICFCLLLGQTPTGKHDVIIQLYEELTKEYSHYVLNVKSIELLRVDSTTGSQISEIKKYSIHDRRLFCPGNVLLDADDVLFQGELDGMDFIVVREEYNSFSNPWRILRLLAGHPVQVSRIIVLVVKNGKAIVEEEIVKKPSSYDWQAKILR